jgi:predicted HicB family RNase H-like nuclease
MLSVQVENAGCKIVTRNVTEIRLRLRVFDDGQEVLTCEFTEPVEPGCTLASVTGRFKARMQEAIHAYKANQAATQNPAVNALAGEVASALVV